MLCTASRLVTAGTAWILSGQKALIDRRAILVNTPHKLPFAPFSSTSNAASEHTNKMEEEIITETSGNVGVITLNRPRALNSLNLNMVDRLFEVYSGWDDSNSHVSCIVLQGAGGKAFCAGGDVKSVVLSAMSNDYSPGIEFFRSEYRTDFLIAQLQKPHISILDGITMGGGAGISMHGSFRVATENTLFAMPECGIGLFPDVGASHFLQKLPGSLGTYLALTGARIKGAEVKAAGLATHYIPSHRLADVMAKLQQLGPAASDLSRVNDVLCEIEARESPPASQLLPLLPVINAAFGEQHSVEGMVEALRSSSTQREFCGEALQLLTKGSPLSAKVTLEMLRRTRSAQLATCLLLDFQLAVRFTRGEGDFLEGVRATLIDKGSTPRWKYPSIDRVPQEVVEAFFQCVEDVAGLELQHPRGLTGSRL